MKIYIATPVNGRKEKTLRAKLEAAEERVAEIYDYIHGYYPSADWYSVFKYMEAEYLETCEESEIMGACVNMVIQCDMIVLDDGWESSRGCTIERYIAMQYGKQIRTINWFKMQEVLTKITDKAKEL